MALSTMENIAIARIVIIGLAVAASFYAASQKDEKSTSHSRAKSASNRHSSLGGKTCKRR